MPFLPRPGDTLEFDGRTFTFIQHKVARDPMVHAETGARATVYLLSDGHEDWALKVFRPKYRKAHQVEIADRLRRLTGFAGLRAAQRHVVPPAHELVGQHKDLAYAQLMPWIEGVPWFNILTVGVMQNDCFLNPAHALHLCHRFLSVMVALEQHGLAHTDIASGNVLVDPDRLNVELIDLEEMCGPGFPEPAQRNVGSMGYTHPSVKAQGVGLWSPDCDRFAGVVLAAEILLLSCPDLARRADRGGGFFIDSSFGQSTSEYHAACAYLRQVAPRFESMFSQAWYSAGVRDCPAFTDTYHALSEVMPWVPHPSGTALVPMTHQGYWRPATPSRRPVPVAPPPLPPRPAPPPSFEPPPANTAVMSWQPIAFPAPSAPSYEVWPAAATSSAPPPATPVYAVASPAPSAPSEPPSATLSSPSFPPALAEIERFAGEGLRVTSHRIITPTSMIPLPAVRSVVVVHRPPSRAFDALVAAAGCFCGLLGFSLNSLWLMFGSAFVLSVTTGLAIQRRASVWLRIEQSDSSVAEVPMATAEAADQAVLAMRAGGTIVAGALPV